MESETFSSAVRLHSELMNAWKRIPHSLDQIEAMLDKLKSFLLQLQYLPHTGEPDKRYLQLARDTLEIAVLWSVEAENVTLFERYLSQLKTYYFDYQSILSDSPYKYQILGLNLMHLLGQNRLAEFHTELELLSIDNMTDVYIMYPVSLEQYLMEGSYHKVFLSKMSLPAPNYHFFVERLMQTIREEIASCAEKAYDRIAVSDACKVLGLEAADQLTDFQTKRNWRLDETGQYLIFASTDKQHEEAHFIKSVPLILQSLGYAKELEKIV